MGADNLITKENVANFCEFDSFEVKGDKTADENFVFTTPIVFAIFSRPDTTFKVFERIRKAKPPKLFIYADGARDNKPGEAERCQQCREVKNMVDWDCKVYTNFAKVNLGCRRRMASGITWAFEHVNEAIILEDDCLPDMSFFRFCQELLEKYRDDNRVVNIGGTNHGNVEHFDESYNFVEGYSGCWGWATWKRAWALYDDDMTMWPECRKKEWLRRIYNQDWFYTHMTNEYQMTYEGKIDTWDYRFSLSARLNHVLGIIPRVNMVRNIGYKVDATHTINPLDKNAFYMDEELKFPLLHPKVMVPRNNNSNPPPPPHLHPNIMPSQEEIQAEFNERITHFQELLKQNRFHEMIAYFKDTLQNCRSIYPEYIYHVALAYIIIGDYNHGESLLDDLFYLNVPTDYAKEFVKSEKKKKLLEMMNSADQNMPDMPGIPGMPKLPGMPGMPGMPTSEFDIDKMIKDIDAKIAELEKEEEEEKKRALGTKANEEKQNEKVESINNIIDLPSEIIEEKKEEIKPLDDVEPFNFENFVKEEPQVKKERTDGAPNINEVVHSNMVNLENFKLKETKEEEKKEEPKKEEKIIPESISNAPADDDMDDFFDDFFFEE